MYVNKPKSPPRTSAGTYNSTIVDSGRGGLRTEVGVDEADNEGAVDVLVIVEVAYGES
jgi:hypothetical protein